METHYLCLWLQNALGVPWIHSKPLPLSSAIKRYSLTVTWISRHSLCAWSSWFTGLLLPFSPLSLHYIFMWFLPFFFFFNIFLLSHFLLTSMFYVQHNFVPVWITVPSWAFNKPSLKISSFYYINVTCQECWEVLQALGEKKKVDRVIE